MWAPGGPWGTFKRSKKSNTIAILLSYLLVHHVDICTDGMTAMMGKLRHPSKINQGSNTKM